MRNMIIAGVVIGIIALGGGIYYVTMRDSGSGETTSTAVSTGDQAEIGDTKSACELFTLDTARSVLGESATASDLPPGAQASTDDVSVTNCLYEAEGASDFATVSLLARGAKTSTGAQSNVFGFEGNQDRSNFEGVGGEFGPTEPIDGLGQRAFFDPDFEQVNVLVDDGRYWLIVQADSREQSEQIARLVLSSI